MSDLERSLLCELAETCWRQERSVEVYRSISGTWCAQAATYTLDEVSVWHEERAEAMRLLRDRLDPGSAA
jgi:hypothetical protein